MTDRPLRATSKRDRVIDERHIALADPDVSVQIRRTRSARRMSLSVSHVHGGVRLTIPTRCTSREMLGFLDMHREWLRESLARGVSPVRLELGASVPIRGILHDVERHATAASGVRLEDGRALVGTRVEAIGPYLHTWLKEQARADLLARSHYHAEGLGTSFTRIAIRDTRSRWGSCSSNGTLSYSWRLILAPPEVLDYVAAHEACHLLEMNHSSRFWALVEKRCPDWRFHRDWLRGNGSELHRYRA